MIAEDGGDFRCGRVGLFGWTNVGKSTLLNRLVGVKLAAVADVAQTTRRRILAVRHVEGRGQILFVDTPGLHRPRHRMNRAMVETVRETGVAVDLALWVIDAFRGIGRGDCEAAELLRRAGAPTVMVPNKIDLVRPKTRLLPLLQRGVEEFGVVEVVPVSATTGDGCERLVEVVLGHLPAAPPEFDEEYLTDQSQRSIAAEWIREKLLARTRQELPHATAVVVERWHERDDGLLEIRAVILVDRESQKKIVIGRGGGLLKEVGRASRAELEAFLERRIYLELWVKVREDWRDDATILRSLDLI